MLFPFVLLFLWPLMATGQYEVCLREKCFQLSVEETDWFEAAERCEKLSGHLVTPYAEDQADLVVNIARHLGINNNIWLGLFNPADHLPRWTWLTGRAITFASWEPASSTGSGRCAQLSKQSWKWSVSSCEEKAGYACQLPNNKAADAPQEDNGDKVIGVQDTDNNEAPLEHPDEPIIMN